MRRVSCRSACTTLLLAIVVSMFCTKQASAANSDSSFGRNLQGTLDRMALPPADPHVPMQVATTSPDSATLCPTAETTCPAVETHCPTVDTKCPPRETKCPVAATKCPPAETRCPARETRCPPAEIGRASCRERV